MRKTILIAIIAAATSIVSHSCAQTTTYKAKLTPLEFSEKMKTLPDAPVIDVRTPAEFAEGHVINALNYDWNGSIFDQQIQGLDKSKPVLVYCRSGSRSAAAAAHMRTIGFKEVYEMDGGFMDWRSANLPETNSR